MLSNINVTIYIHKGYVVKSELSLKYTNGESELNIVITQENFNFGKVKDFEVEKPESII